MSKRPKASRRPSCEFCGELFRPNPKVGERQYACSKPECQRQRHLRNCRQLRERQRPAEQEERLAISILTHPLPPASPTASPHRGPPKRAEPRAGSSPEAELHPDSTACFNWEWIQERWGLELVAVLKLILTAARRGG